MCLGNTKALKAVSNTLESETFKSLFNFQNSNDRCIFHSFILSLIQYTVSSIIYLVIIKQVPCEMLECLRTGHQCVGSSLECWTKDTVSITASLILQDMSVTAMAVLNVHLTCRQMLEDFCTVSSCKTIRLMSETIICLSIRYYTVYKFRVH